MPFGIFIRGGRRIPVDRFSMLPRNSGQDCLDVSPSGQEAEKPYGAEDVEVIHADGPVLRLANAGKTPAVRSAPRARVGGVVDGEQALGFDRGVALGRRQTGVAKQFLDFPQIAAAIEQVGREAVPQRVRVDVR